MARSDDRMAFKLVVQKSNLDGKQDGLFTLENIAANVSVIEYEGTRAKKDDHTDHTHCFEYDSQIHIIGNGLARFIQDVYTVPSRSPNLRFKYYHPAKKVYLVSNRRITAGSELTVSYGEQYWKEHKLEHIGAVADVKDDGSNEREFNHLLKTTPDRLAFGDDVTELYNEGALSKIWIYTMQTTYNIDKLNVPHKKTVIISIAEPWLKEVQICGVRWY